MKQIYTMLYDIDIELSWWTSMFLLVKCWQRSLAVLAKKLDKWSTDISLILAIILTIPGQEQFTIRPSSGVKPAHGRHQHWSGIEDLFTDLLIGLEDKKRWGDSQVFSNVSLFSLESSWWPIRRTAKYCAMRISIFLMEDTPLFIGHNLCFCNPSRWSFWFLRTVCTLGGLQISSVFRIFPGLPDSSTVFLHTKQICHTFAKELWVAYHVSLFRK